MSLKEFEHARELLEKNFVKEEYDFHGVKSASLVHKAEKLLGIIFPNSYKAFLSNYGVGGIGSDEIYGLIDEASINSGAPDVVWINFQERKNSSLPFHLIAIFSGGEGTLYCLDTSQFNEERECPVVAWPINHCKNSQNLEKVADSFGEFFLQLVKRRISKINSR